MGANGMLIGELAKATGVTAETIRFYEREGVIPAPKRQGQGRYRLYDEAEARRLRFVRRARDLGFGLDEVRELMELADGDPDEPCDDVDGLVRRHMAEIDLKVARLTALRSELKRLVSGCDPRAGSRDCGLLSALND